jgi:hypothetical protein
MPERTDAPTQTVYLANITKTLGGPTGWVTPFIVQNTGTTGTNLEISFYRFSDGECVARRTTGMLPPRASFADIPNNDPDLPRDTQFSVVVRSFGSNIVAVVNEHAGSGSRAEAMSYNGVSRGALTVYLPNVVRRFFGYHSPFIIQNLGAAATMATATFRPFAGGPSMTVTRSIAPGRSQFIEPNVEPGLRDGTQYAVMVTALQPIAVVVNTHNDDPGIAHPVAYSTNGIVDGAETIYGPFAAKNSDSFGGFRGTTTTIVIQNLGPFVETPALTIRQPGGGSALATFLGPEIAPGEAWAFDPRYRDGAAGTTLCGSNGSEGCLADGVYAFTVTSPGATLAAAVNIISPETAAGYIAISRLGPTVYLPNVTRHLGGELGWSTQIYVYGGGYAVFRRFGSGEVVTTESPNNGLVDPRPMNGLPDGQYSVELTTEGTGLTGAIVLELNFQGGDGAMAYEGFPAP